MTTPLNNLTDTWNNGSTVFTGLKYNITNTASAAGSLLADFQVGGTSLLRLSHADGFTGDAGAAFLLKIPFSSVYGGLCGNSGSGNSIVVGLSSSNGAFGSFDSGLSGAPGTFKISNAMYFGWGTTSWGAGDTYLGRDAAGIIAQRRDANAQTFRVYNTYTDSSNYERGVFDWTSTSNLLTIGAQAAGTGVVRNVQFVAGGGSGFTFTHSGVSCLQIISSTTYMTSLTLDYANADVVLARGAAGIFKFASSQSFSANTTVATVLGSLGPTGANTTVQEWLTIKNASGTTRYIPCF